MTYFCTKCGEPEHQGSCEPSYITVSVTIAGLVKSLRDAALEPDLYKLTSYRAQFVEAASTLERLATENARLREVLKPFSDEADDWIKRDDGYSGLNRLGEECGLTVQHLFNARKAYKNEEEKESFVWSVIVDFRTVAFGNAATVEQARTDAKKAAEAHPLIIDGKSWTLQIEIGSIASDYIPTSKNLRVDPDADPR